ncbi:MAG: hypothetical protein E6848_21965, partial [Bradyrhizobium sp.]|nr:hypothetical protein [Bradyrhizobium sp.]
HGRIFAECIGIAFQGLNGHHLLPFLGMSSGWAPIEPCFFVLDKRIASPVGSILDGWRLNDRHTPRVNLIRNCK